MSRVATRNSVSEDGEQQRVTFTVKELLNRIDGKLDTMAIAIQQKADAAEVERLKGQLQSVQGQIESWREQAQTARAEWQQMKGDIKTLQNSELSENSVQSYRRWLIVTALTAIGATAGLVSQLVHFKF